MVATSQAAAAPASDERRSAPFTFLDREVQLYEPSTGQSYILLTVLNLTDESATAMEQINTIRMFGVMLGSLFVDQGDLNHVMGTMARGGDVQDFLDLAGQMAQHWDIAEPDEPANREERRAAPRRAAPKGPVKAAARTRR
jgi:hypothetical protein